MSSRKHPLSALALFWLIIGVSAHGQEIMAHAPKPLITPTYDGVGQVTEPSIVYFAHGWHGFKYWLVVAPYPHANAQHENPAILVSDDGLTWSLPQGERNPVERPPAGGHLDDSSLFYDQESDQLWLFYLMDLKTSYSALMRITSADGVHWSEPRLALLEPTLNLVMPTWPNQMGATGCGS